MKGGDDMTNEELAERLQNGEDVQLDLYEQNKRLLFWCMKPYRQHAEEQDMLQAGFIGLIEAARRYDPGQGGFSNYAVHWIRAEMRKCLGCGVHIPANRRELLVRYRRYIRDQEAAGLLPSDAEICQALAVRPDELEEIRRADAAERPTSMQAPFDADGNTLADVLPCPWDPFDRVEIEQDRELLAGVLWPIVDGLPGQQAAVVRQRYQHGRTFQQIAEVVGITGSQAHVLHGKALRQLRKRQYRETLLPFAEDHRYSLGLACCGVAVFNHSWTSSTERAALRYVR